MMTMRRILQCVVAVFVLAMAGCTGNEGNTSPPEKKPSAPTKTNSNLNSNPTSSAQSGQNVTEKNGNDGRDGEIKATPERKGQQTAKTGDNANTPATSEGNSLTSGNINGNSNLSATPIDQSLKSADQNQNSSEQDQKHSNQTEETFPSSVMDWVILGLLVAGGLLVLVIIGMGLLHLRNQSRRHIETNIAKAAAAQVSVTREAQKEILDKISSLSSAQNETGSRLHDVHTEIRSLARLVRESSPERGDGRRYAPLTSSYDPAPPKEEPDFPVSAVDYLGKMTRFSNVVKPDFQNGILISDPEGKGELMLIRDSRRPDETQPLFVVPRHAQFQTKQDFYTYYEKYYDCVRPSAGDVWIIDPAVVEKVSGGWQLREKGVLEIR